MKLYYDIKDLLNDWDIKIENPNFNFHILKIEDHFANRPYKFGPYQQDFFELTFGSGHDVDLKIGTSGFNSITEVLSFTAPYQIASWQINGFNENSLGIMVFFKYEILGQQLNKIEFHRRYPFLNLHSSPALSLTKEQREVVVGIMQNLLFEFQSRRGSEIVLRSYLTILLEKVKEFYDAEETHYSFTSRAQEITHLFENKIKAQTNYKLKLADYAAQLHISSAYLSEAVKKASKRTPHTIIQEYIILQAKSLLHQTDMTIAGISEDLGFEEASNFVKYFKKAVGVTPLKYRTT